jgi:hypothetical protein
MPPRGIFQKLRSLFESPKPPQRPCASGLAGERAPSYLKWIPIALPGCRVRSDGSVTFERLGFAGRIDQSPGVTEILFDIGREIRGSLHVAGLNSRLRLAAPLKPTEPWVEFSASWGNLVTIASRKILADRLLGPEARKALESIRYDGSLLYRISPAGFLLRVYRPLASRSQLQRWMTAADVLLGKVVEFTGRAGLNPGVQAQGVEIVITDDAFCQICSSTLSRGTRVDCSRCSTPHHKDCWEFNGRCSTFACGEARFILP